MKTLLIITLIVAVAFVLKSCVSGDQLANDPSRAPEDELPTTEKANDKIILVDGVSHDDIKNALTKFCNMYNKDRYNVLPKLWQLSPSSYAVTFPYDVDFASYCFAVNFLKYPTNIKWHAQVFAWTTTKAGDEWITDKSVDKKVMLFLADDDKEYDNVFLTTQDNIGYKLGFAMGQEKQLLKEPKQLFKNQSIKIEDLKDQKNEDFK